MCVSERVADANLETEISEGTFSPLPPIQERSLSPSEIQELRPYFEAMLNGQAFQVLMLCRYTKTLSVGEFVIGAKGSKHSKSHIDGQREMVPFLRSCHVCLRVLEIRPRSTVLDFSVVIVVANQHSLSLCIG